MLGKLLLNHRERFRRMLLVFQNRVEVIPERLVILMILTH